MQNIEIVSNPTLEELVAFMSAQPVDFSLLGNPSDVSKDPRRVKGLCAERHLALALRRASRAPGLEGVVPHLIDPGTSSRNFEFLQSDPTTDGVVAWNARAQRETAEYDAVGRAGVPFVAETKSGHRAINAKQQLQSFLPNQGEINCRLSPLAELLGTRKFGYLVAGPHDIFNAKIREELATRGILVVSFPVTSRDFKEGVEKALQPGVEVPRALPRPRTVVDLLPARSSSKSHFKKRR